MLKALGLTRIKLEKRKRILIGFMMQFLCMDQHEHLVVQPIYKIIRACLLVLSKYLTQRFHLDPTP